jgi:hypothetical protein
MAPVLDWCITSYQEDAPEFNFAIMDYLCYQRETCPSTGNKHWQGYVQFSTGRAKSAALRLLGWLNNGKSFTIRAARGDDQDNYDYCSKNDTSVEGTWKEHGARQTIAKTKETVPKFHEACKAGTSEKQLWEDFPNLMSSRMRDYTRLSLLYAKVREYKDGERPVLKFYIGPTSSGKSRAAFADHPGAYSFDIGNGGSSTWACGYQGQETIIFDEFRGEGLSTGGRFRPCLSRLRATSARCW